VTKEANAKPERRKEHKTHDVGPLSDLSDTSDNDSDTSDNDSDKMNWNNLNELLKPGVNCVITTHYSIDGDAIGTEVALAEFIRQRGGKAVIVNQDPTPRIYRFLEQDEDVRVWSSELRGAVDSADLIFIVDVAVWERVGAPAEAMQEANATRVCIDHHATSGGIAELNLLDSSAAAAGMLVYDLIRSTGGEITPSIARALFVAIATDTGWFRFSNTSPEVLEAAAELTRAGVDVNRIYTLVYEQLRRERLALLSRGLAEFDTTEDGRIIWMALTRAMFEESGADDEDVEGLIDILRTIGGVEIAILFRETPDGRVRASMRSKETADVSRVAGKFRGGGHARSAGMNVPGTLDEIVPKVIEAAKEEISPSR